MYCTTCGKIIDDYARVCPKCGAPVDNPKPRTESPYLIYPSVPKPAPPAPAAPAPAPAPAPPVVDDKRRKKKHRRHKK
ncbi:MAG: zinc-ribbon domain-containing protein [Clostridia bacterium]|nr:zinc-ribbon domain-containing protein [Clostridia bacterium]